MKKIFLIILIILLTFHVKAQLINSVAITGGVSYGNQKFYFNDPAAISGKKYFLGFNGSFFVEFFSNNYARWVSEIQFNQKGSIDKQPDANYANKLQYLSWNNYLKLRYELFSVIPYVLGGPRLDYNLTQATTSPVITGKFLPLNISAAIGGGIEFVNYYNFKFFIEGFYNPDAIPSYLRPSLQIKNKNFELRVGLKYEFVERKERCNAPTYTE